jgi:hypothetical protein
MSSPPETGKSPRSSKDPESPKSTGSNAAEGPTGVGILPASHWQQASQVRGFEFMATEDYPLCPSAKWTLTEQ